MNNDVKWSVYNGIPIEEPSEEEINQWRMVAKLWVGYNFEIEQMERRMARLKAMRDALAHVLDRGPRNNVLDSLKAQHNAAPDTAKE